MSELNAELNAELTQFARQPLSEEYPYVFLDARYEQVWEAGVIQEPGGIGGHRDQLERAAADTGGGTGWAFSATLNTKPRPASPLTSHRWPTRRPLAPQ